MTRATIHSHEDATGDNFEFRISNFGLAEEKEALPPALSCPRKGERGKVAVAHSGAGAYPGADYVQLAKPRITIMVATTAWVGFAFRGGHAAGDSGGGWLTVTAAVLGTALACASSAVFNQVLERDTDALMRRTRRRPLPAGRVQVAQASLYGCALAVIALGILAAGTNVLAAALAAWTIAAYLLVYTPLKRVTSVATVLGAIPGAMPPVIGYAAATGTVDLAALALFAVMFLWQLPHFLAIAWLYREDYARAGMPMLPVLDPSGGSTFRQMVIGCVALLPISLWPTLLGLTGGVYFYGTLALGLAFLGVGLGLVRWQTTGWARGMFYASLVYLPAVFVLLLVDRVGQ